MAADHASALKLLFDRMEVRDRLSATEKAALADAAGEFRFFPRETSIVREGDRPSVCALLVSGLASRYNMTEGGGRQITAVHVPGDFVDLHSFPLKKMDHGIGALTDCEVLVFSHARLVALTEAHPHLTRVLWMLTLLDGAIHRRWLVAMGRTSALSHTAHFLCEMYLRLEIVGLASGHVMPLPITQLELSDVLGISAVHTNRVLQELRSSGLISWVGTEVRILDWKYLTSAGQFDDSFLFLERIPR